MTMPDNKISRVRFTALSSSRGFIVVNHPFEKQALGRAARNSPALWRLHASRISRMASAGSQGQRPISASVPTMLRTIARKKRLPGNAKYEFFALLLPIAGINPTDAIFSFMGRHAKRGEIVLTNERVTRPFYRSQIEFAPQVPRIVPTNGLFGITDAVKIMPTPGIKTRVKVRRNAIGLFDRDIRRQHAIERVLQAVEW